jgi:hypothetical protein
MRASPIYLDPQLIVFSATLLQEIDERNAVDFTMGED